jgi:hypothetical protein
MDILKNLLGGGQDINQTISYGGTTPGKFNAGTEMSKAGMTPDIDPREITKMLMLQQMQQQMSGGKQPHNVIGAINSILMPYMLAKQQAPYVTNQMRQEQQAYQTKRQLDQLALEDQLGMSPLERKIKLGVAEKPGDKAKREAAEINQKNMMEWRKQQAESTAVYRQSQAESTAAYRQSTQAGQAETRAEHARHDRAMEQKGREPKMPSSSSLATQTRHVEKRIEDNFDESYDDYGKALREYTGQQDALDLLRKSGGGVHIMDRALVEFTSPPGMFGIGGGRKTWRVVDLPTAKELMSQNPDNTEIKMAKGQEETLSSGPLKGAVVDNPETQAELSQKLGAGVVPPPVRSGPGGKPGVRMGPLKAPPGPTPGQPLVEGPPPGGAPGKLPSGKPTTPPPLPKDVKRGPPRPGFPNGKPLSSAVMEFYLSKGYSEEEAYALAIQ